MIPSRRGPSEALMLDPKLLEILACPRCKGAVEPAADHGSLVCRACRLRYRVEDDIPIMLIEEATSLEEDPGDD
jgi:uncharacterized protein YbaR (Trm112 family)